MQRIVVIDDCKLTLAIVRDILEEAGFEVFTAESGIDTNAIIYSLLAHLSRFLPIPSAQTERV